MVLRKIQRNLGVDALNNLRLPNSILIIPDGNGRWAKKEGLGTDKGHEAGGKAIGELLEHFLNLNTKIIGIWGFSEDNWKRDREEIDNIMSVISHTVETNLDKLKKNKVKFLFLGNTENIGSNYPEVLSLLEQAERETSDNGDKILALFLDYGVRFQLEEFAKERAKNPTISTTDILSKVNKDLPLFDMVLRTSGEQRLSGFGPLAEMAEYVSVKKNLPDMKDEDLGKALIEYTKRDRRFGGRRP